MRINNLYKVGIKDNHRVKEIEDYLEREIVEILEKRRFDDEPMQSRFHSRDDYVGSNLRGFRSLDARNGSREDYLPFNKEEIRPVLRDSINSGRIEDLIMESIIPGIEEWLDNNLERIVHRVVKRYVNKRALMEEQEMNEREVRKQQIRRKNRYDR